MTVTAPARPPATIAPAPTYQAPTPVGIPPTIATNGQSLLGIALEVGAVFVATVIAGGSDSEGNLMLAIVVTLWILSLIHHYSS